MAFGSVTLKPGVDLLTTPTDSEAGINAGNLIRWKAGLVEKIGGWIRYYPVSIGSVVRDLHPWQDLNNNLRLGVGADASLSVITNGVNEGITPQITTTNSTPDFTTTMGSSTVTIVDSNLVDPTVDNSVFIQTPVSVGGLILSGIYPIASIISGTSYTIEAASAAVSSVPNGGAVAVYDTTLDSSTVQVTLNNHGLSNGDSYYVAVGATVGGVTIAGSYLVSNASTNTFDIIANAIATASATGSENGGNVRFIYYITIGAGTATTGYGVGGYGLGGYGTGVSPTPGTGTPITAADWSQGNWGEILLANPTGGGVYQWRPGSGFQTAQLVPQAPISNIAIFVTMPQQILVSIGASFDGAPNPLAVAWSDAGDYTAWTPTSTNFAGSYLIPRGSMLVGGLQGPTQNLLWTDLGVWSMQYINLPLVFGFNEIMSGCGLIGSHAAVLAEGTVFWMSQNQFFAMPAGGGPSPLPCTVWDAIFQDLDRTNAYKIRAGANSSFNEIWWHYPSASGGSGENDSYVKFNLVEGEWDNGQLPTTGRSAWIDQSVLGPPLGAGPNGIIYQHEEGYDGDGQALNPYIETGYWVVGEGEDYAFVDQVLPDFTYGTYNAAQTATPILTLYSVDYPNGPRRTYGPYSMAPAVQQITTRLRGRQMAMRIESQDANSFWRIGKCRFRAAPDGRR